MKYESTMISDDEFNALFNEALYAFDDDYLFFRKARYGESFIRANR